MTLILLLTGMYPANPALEGGVKGDNIKGNHLTGKPRPLGRGASLLPVFRYGLDNHFRVVHGPCQITPLIDSFVDPRTGLIRPNVLELVFKNQDGMNDSVQS